MQQRPATVFSVVSFVVDDKVGSNCLRFRFSVKRTKCPYKSLLRIKVFRKARKHLQSNACVGIFYLKTTRVRTELNGKLAGWQNMWLFMLPSSQQPPTKTQESLQGSVMDGGVKHSQYPFAGICYHQDHSAQYSSHRPQETIKI